MKKKCFITIVNEDYKEYVGQLIKSHSLFSNIDLIVYTINFRIYYMYVLVFEMMCLFKTV